MKQLVQAEREQSVVRRRRVAVIDLGIPRRTARRVAAWVMQVPPQRDEESARLLKQLKQSESRASRAIELAERFLRIVRQRTPEKLDPWFEAAEQSEIVPLVKFAQGLREDYEAIKAGLRVELSNGLACIIHENSQRSRRRLIRLS